MSLIKFNSDELFPKIDSFWNDFFNTDFNKSISLGTTIPAVNTKETKDAFVLDVAIPGMKKDDFNVSLENNVLTISSEKKEEKEEKEGEKITRNEFSYSSFRRSFDLPEMANKDAISAEYQDGLLRLTIPKIEPKQIEVKKQIEIK